MFVQTLTFRKDSPARKTPYLELFFNLRGNSSQGILTVFPFLEYNWKTENCK